MTPERIASLRLYCQRITGSDAADPAAVLSRLGALQAQDYDAAIWAIGLRLPNGTIADIHRAIADRTIVRTWPMRGTLHFVAARDVRWMLRLLAPRAVAAAAGRHRQLGLDDAAFAHGHEVIAASLQGGITRTRDAIYQSLEEAGIATAAQRGYMLLWRAAQEGRICFAAHEGKQPAFALLDDWLPPGSDWTPPDPLAELARRYFTGHGPATVQDFAWWAGLKLSDARAGLAASADTLRSEEVGGRTYWMPREEPPADSGATPSLHLLPGFDEYLLGYRDRDIVLAPEHAGKIVPGSNGVFLPTIVVDGKIVGTWKRTVKRSTVVIEPVPFSPLSADQIARLRAAAERYARFRGLEVVV